MFERVNKWIKIIAPGHSQTIRRRTTHQRKKKNGCLWAVPGSHKLGVTRRFRRVNPEDPSQGVEFYPKEPVEWDLSNAQVFIWMTLYLSKVLILFIYRFDTSNVLYTTNLTFSMPAFMPVYLPMMHTANWMSCWNTCYITQCCCSL